jgi:hypothetical protein
MQLNRLRMMNGNIEGKYFLLWINMIFLFPSFMNFSFHVIGKIISACCFILGWFMPHFFAGRLESGNVCEYFIMMHYFQSLGIKDHDKALFEMGVKEKEHEVYFLNQIQDSKFLPFFEKMFGWGNERSFNDLDYTNIESVKESTKYCRK